MDERTQNRKNGLYAGLLSGFLFAILFGVSMGWVPPHSSFELFAPLVAGALFGGMFGPAMVLFANSKFVARSVSVTFSDGESVEYEAPANHFLNGEARGGRLYLTNRSLTFQPHGFNLQSTPVTIPRDEISGAQAGKTLGVIPNGLTVKTRAGAKDQFVVSNSGEWLRRLAA